MQHFDEDDIKWLAELLEAEGLDEIEVEEHDESVVVSARPLAPPPAQSNPEHAALPASPPQPAVPQDVIPVPAPMTGVFYRAPSPSSPPCVEVGDAVERGDILGLIEAMKMFNEVTAPVSGTIVQVLVYDQQEIEADQPLMLIKLTSE